MRVVRTLERGYHVHVEAGSRVRCIAGTLWVTQRGDSRDHFLIPGGSMTVCAAGGALMEAWGDEAVLSIEPAARRASWWVRLRRHLPGNRAGNVAC